MLCLPVQLIGTNGFELGEEGENDSQIEVMTQVCPDSYAKGEVRSLDIVWPIDIVECFGCLGEPPRISRVFDSCSGGRQVLKKLTARKKSLIS